MLYFKKCKTKVELNAPMARIISRIRCPNSINHGFIHPNPETIFSISNMKKNVSIISLRNCTHKSARSQQHKTATTTKKHKSINVIYKPHKAYQTVDMYIYIVLGFALRNKEREKNRINNLSHQPTHNGFAHSQLHNILCTRAAFAKRLWGSPSHNHPHTHKHTHLPTFTKGL